MKAYVIKNAAGAYWNNYVSDWVDDSSPGDCVYSAVETAMLLPEIDGGVLVELEEVEE